MNSPNKRFLFCQCAFSAIIPDARKSRIEQALRASGAELVSVPDLCLLAEQHDPQLRELAATPGLTIVACHPRAVRWLFHFGGADLTPDATLLDQRDQEADEILRLAAIPTVEDSPSSSRPSPPPHAAAPPAWPAWFPVLDESRCVNCKQCLAFCVFGVYQLSAEGRVRVAQPRNCKNNCPACARTCPAQAIIFPKCPDAPINGAEVTSQPADPTGTHSPEPKTQNSEIKTPAGANLDALLAKRKQRAEAFRQARAGTAEKK